MYSKYLAKQYSRCKGGPEGDTDPGLFQMICFHVGKREWATFIKGGGWVEKNYRFRPLIFLHPRPLYGWYI